MATELREARVKLVLDTKGALDQAERQGQDDADARSRGADQPGGGGEHGGNKPDGTKDRKPSDRGREDAGHQSAAGQLWDTGKAAWNGGLVSKLRGLVEEIPIIGSSVEGTIRASEFAAEYGPMAAAAARSAFGGKGGTKAADETTNYLIEKYQWLEAHIRAIDLAIVQTKQAAMVGAKLWGADVDGFAIANFAVASYKVASALEQVRLARHREEMRALGTAGGAAVAEFGEMVYDTVNEMTRLAAGR